MTESSTIVRLASLFPIMEPQAAIVARSIYQLLTRFDAVTPNQISATSGVQLDVVTELLQRWPAIYLDDNGCIIGFWGLTGQEMHHQFIVAGKVRHTWCAWDALFIPELINQTATIKSMTAIEERPVLLEVCPTSVSNQSPDSSELFISFNLPSEEDWEDNILASFCHHVHFLYKEEVGQWLQENPSGTTLRLQRAFNAGLAKNARQFGKITQPAAD